MYWLIAVPLTCRHCAPAGGNFQFPFPFFDFLPQPHDPDWGSEKQLATNVTEKSEVKSHEFLYLCAA